MKISKKLILILYLVLLVPLLVGCDLFSTFTFEQRTTTETTSSAVTTTDISNSDIITVSNDNYNSFPVYNNPVDSMTVAQYNQLLYDTKEHIRYANIQITASLYDYIQIFRTTQKQVVSVSYGSGFIFKADADYYYAITNYHVVDPEGHLADYAIKTFSDTTQHEADLIAYDSSKDLAVIRFAKENRTDIEFIDITSRLYYQFKPGELVMAVGNPESLENNVTFGEFISMEDISQYLPDQNLGFDVIYHNASIHPGSSGGALVDAEGNLLGVNTWGDTTSDEYSFAIPNYIVYQFLINKGILN